MFLNFGIKHKYQAAVDALIETLTDLKTLHIGNKATYILNQREGLKGMCLKTPKGTLYNLSENLNYAFFWPSKLPNELEIYQKNGKYFAAYKASDYSIANDSKDLVAVYYHKYRENLPTTPEMYRAEMNAKFLARYATTTAATESTSSWKFSHWEQFIDTNYDKIEFCFKPVFKLDRVIAQVHTCPILQDTSQEIIGYSDGGENQNYSFSRLGCWLIYPYWANSAGVNEAINDRSSTYAGYDNWAIGYYQGAYDCYIYSIIYGYSHTSHVVRELKPNGTINIVDYYQHTIRFSTPITNALQYREQHYGTPQWKPMVIHGCSHQANASVPNIVGIPVPEGNPYVDTYNYRQEIRYTNAISFTGKQQGASLPNPPAVQSDPHENITFTTEWLKDFSIDYDNDTYTKQLASVGKEKNPNLLDFNDMEHLINDHSVERTFDVQLDDNTWYRFTNIDSPHGMDLKLRNPNVYNIKRTWIKKFGVISKWTETKYVYPNELSWPTFYEYYKNNGSEDDLFLIRSDTVKCNAYVMIGASNHLITDAQGNQHYIEASSDYGKYITVQVQPLVDAEFAKEDNYTEYTDETFDTGPQFIKVSDTYYKIPKELVEHFSIPGGIMALDLNSEKKYGSYTSKTYTAILPIELVKHGVVWETLGDTLRPYAIVLQEGYTEDKDVFLVSTKTKICTYTSDIELSISDLMQYKDFDANDSRVQSIHFKVDHIDKKINNYYVSEDGLRLLNADSYEEISLNSPIPGIKEFIDNEKAKYIEAHPIPVISKGIRSTMNIIDSNSDSISTSKIAITCDGVDRFFFTFETDTLEDNNIQLGNQSKTILYEVVGSSLQKIATGYAFWSVIRNNKCAGLTYWFNLSNGSRYTFSKGRTYSVMIDFNYNNKRYFTPIPVKFKL